MDIISAVTRNPQNTPAKTIKTIIVAGGTGDLGSRIIFYLIQFGVRVKVLVRTGSNRDTLLLLQNKGLMVIEVDFNNQAQLVKACSGGDCFISALNGLEDVMIDVQTRLLKAAITAGIPRFIPSDYCIDYTKLAPGTNRNLDLRRRFNEHISETPIAATSILNGMFTELLKGPAPVILFGLKRVLYWGDARQLLDFTSIQNTAEYTARAAVDASTPRYLRIAGEVLNVDGLAKAATAATGKEFRPMRAGTLGGLQTMIKITRTLLPKKEEVFPPWQGMQYLHNMFTGLPKLDPLDNDRYPNMQWGNVAEALAREPK